MAEANQSVEQEPADDKKYRERDRQHEHRKTEDRMSWSRSRVKDVCGRTRECLSGREHQQTREHGTVTGHREAFGSSRQLGEQNCGDAKHVQPGLFSSVCLRDIFNCYWRGMKLECRPQNHVRLCNRDKFWGCQVVYGHRVSKDAGLGYSSPLQSCQ